MQYGLILVVKSCKMYSPNFPHGIMEQTLQKKTERNERNRTLKKEPIDHSQTIPKTKRSYQIGRNTGRDLRNLGSKKRNKLEEK